jgi:dTDP-4-amino-4,6-dideoxygalactose transaminase
LQGGQQNCPPFFKKEVVMPIPLLDLKAQYAAIQSEIEPVLKEVCQSQYFILGPQVANFEKSVAEYCQSKFAIGVSSGSDALLVSLMALDIGPGDEVITSAFTFFATAGSIVRTGAAPVFVDVDPHTFNISPAAIEKAITKKCFLLATDLLWITTGICNVYNHIVLGNTIGYYIIF